MLKSNLGSNKEVNIVKTMKASKKILQTRQVLFLKKTNTKEGLKKLLV